MNVVERCVEYQSSADEQIQVPYYSIIQVSFVKGVSPAVFPKMTVFFGNLKFVCCFKGWLFRTICIHEIAWKIAMYVVCNRNVCDFKDAGREKGRVAVINL